MIRVFLTMNMKQLLVLALAILSFQVAWERLQRGEGPEEISEPGYAEHNTRMMMRGQPIERFMHAKMENAAECERALVTLEKDFNVQATPAGLPPSINASRCTEDTGRTPMDRFDQDPASITPLSPAQGCRAECDIRLIPWGIPAVASDANCRRLSQSDWRLAERKGAVRCIQSLVV